MPIQHTGAKSRALLIACVLAAAAAALIARAYCSRSSALDDPNSYSLPLEDYRESLLTGASTVYSVESSEGFSLPDTPFQKVLSRTAPGNTTRITVQSGIPGRTAEKPGKELLDDTRFLDIDSPEIRKIAERFRASKDPVGDVALYVDERIGNKTYGVPIVRALDILKTGAGDCTEHTVLCVALLRSMKIPARAVAGMVFTPEFQGLRNVFAFHMWAEAYYGNRWILVDATRPGLHQANRYIAFSYHHLKTEMPLDYMEAVSAIKNLKVRQVTP